MNEYKDFWNKLSPHYIISKGEIRLPIAKSILNLGSFLSESFIEDLQKSLQDILDGVSEETLNLRLQNKGEGEIAGTKFEGLTGVVRFDCMIDAVTGLPKVVELNSDYPDGLLLHDKTMSVLQNKIIQTHELFLKGNLDPSEFIFILYPEDATFLDAYYSELDFYKNSGVECAIGTFKDLDFKDDYYWYKEKKIDKIRRCCEVYKLPKSFFRKTKTKILNSLHMRALGYKDYLPTEGILFLKSEKLNSENLNKFSKNKDLWVLKPTNLSEGKGIILGTDVEQINWDSALKNALIVGDHILQEYLSPSKINIEYFDDGEIKTEEFYFDICPHFFIENGIIKSTGHILVRFSKEKILNIMRGGALGYGAFV